MMHFAALSISTLAILIRCSFRVAELSGGFNGSLANNQISFMILDGAMMVITVTLLTTAHPGFTIGAIWQAGNFRLRRAKKTSKAEAMRETVTTEDTGNGPGSSMETGVLEKTLRK